jgi:two-component system chemotaxis sensor kinase CheA
MSMRMVPVRGLFKKLARMVRELSRKVGKDVVLQTSGEGAEMDRSMVERLEEPLVHMIRNSIDHGIEDPEARAKTTKSPSATIRLSAYHAGGSVVVEILDDGKGLNRDAIIKKAKQNGLIRDGEVLPDADVYNMIFAPGFSTAAKVTEISGRGVGMDVVKRNIEAMRGRVQIASTSSQGTLFKIVLPLTMAIIDGMLVACGSEVYILPSLLIVESFQPTKDHRHPERRPRGPRRRGPVRRGVRRDGERDEHDDRRGPHADERGHRGARRHGRRRPDEADDRRLPRRVRDDEDRAQHRR